MSLVIDYTTQADSVTGLPLGNRSGTINMKQTQYLDPNRKHGYRILLGLMSNQIPNIYNYGGFNNTTLRITANGGTTWSTIQLPNGIFTVAQLNDNILNVMGQLNYWTNSSAPGFTLNYNPSTTLVYVSLDSTKLAVAGQLGIDLSVSQLGATLGYVTGGQIFLTDGYHSATLPPQLDTQGTYVNIFISVIQRTRTVNGQVSNIVYRVPIINDTTGEIVFPSSKTGNLSTIMRAEIPADIQSADVSFKTDSGQEVVFLYGGVTLSTELLDL